MIGRRGLVRIARAGVLVLVPLAVGGCLPTAVTTEGQDTARLYMILVAIAAVVVVIVLGLTTFAIVRYRRRPGDDELPPQVHGNLRYEVIWTGIPILTIVALLAMTVLVLGSFERAVNATANVNIKVTAFRWGWRFEYPGDGVLVEGTGEPGPEVWVPVGENVHVTLTGADVIHAFFVPQFLFKRDAIPGHETTFAFTVDEAGRYRGQCAEFCGIGHSRMPFTVVAVGRPEYDQWIAAHRGRPAGGAVASPTPMAAVPQGSTP